MSDEHLHRFKCPSRQAAGSFAEAVTNTFEGAEIQIVGKEVSVRLDSRLTQDEENALFYLYTNDGCERAN